MDHSEGCFSRSTKKVSLKAPLCEEFSVCVEYVPLVIFRLGSIVRTRHKKFKSSIYIILQPIKLAYSLGLLSI